MDAGADDYLVKPFSARELLARVESHLNLQRVRRESEEALLEMMAREKQARASAEVANRVKDDFVAVLSHELRTPLNAIVGWTHLLKKGKLSDKDRARGIDIIDRNATAQREIIDELLDVSRIVTGKLKLEAKPIELQSVIEAAIDGVRPAAEAKNIQIVTSMDCNAGLVMLNLKPPDRERLVKIAQAHFGKENHALYEEVAKLIVPENTTQDADAGDLKPQQSAAEFLDTVHACIELKVKPRAQDETWEALSKATLWKPRETPGAV